MESAGTEYQDLEEATTVHSIPAILGWTVTEAERSMISLPVREGGLGISNPTKTAEVNYKTAKASTQHLAKALLGQEKWNPVQHKCTFTAATSNHKSEQTEGHKALKQTLAEHASLSLETRKAFARASNHAHTGAWLTIKPTSSGNTALSWREFQDGTCIRYGKEPRHIPPSCQSCNEPNSLEHALNCKRDGYVWGRHKAVCTTFEGFFKTVLTASLNSVRPEEWLDDPPAPPAPPGLEHYAQHR